MHDAGEPFVLVDDASLLSIPDELARIAESGGATLQWTSRSDSVVSEISVPPAGLALRPLAPVHGRVRRTGDGGIQISWVRRSRADTGWRDHVDVAAGESREAWRVDLVGAIDAGPWETASSSLSIDAATVALLPADAMASIRQIGDFTMSPPLFLPLN